MRKVQSGNLSAVEALARSSPASRLIISHCGVSSSASDIRGLLQRNANVSCDLSYRSPPQLRQRMLGRAIFDRAGVRSDWKQLIEDYPDRFMIGLDDQDSWSDYDETVRNIRAMLAELSPATAEKIAYRNAQSLFGLE